MFSVLIRPAGIPQTQFRLTRTGDRGPSRVRWQALTFGALWSAIAAVIVFIARSGGGS